MNGHPEFSSHALAEQLDVTAREERLHTLLGVDYKYAKESGLIDMFYFDPTTGEDGLMHILEGITLTGEDGGRIPVGYHHEPSSPNPERTYVDRDHMVNANSGHRTNYRENYYEPYNSTTVIDGFRKVGRDGALTKSTMFPKEYDALAVMQAVRQARDHRFYADDTLLENGFMVGHGQAVMVDGTSVMDIKLVFAPEDERVLTAYPYKVRKNVMGLGRRATSAEDAQASKNKQKIDEHLGLS